MEFVPPRIFGPLSECSRSLRFENLVAGATLAVVRTRGGQTETIAKAQSTTSSGVATFEPGMGLLGGDRVSTYQYDATGASQWQPDPIEVQKSTDKFNPPQLYGPVYQCSQGFAVGGLRPGTRVELLEGGWPIGSGLAVDGTAFMRLHDGLGLPTAGTQLDIRQIICPRPPPPSATEWVIYSQLPPIEALPAGIAVGGKLPAPNIIGGLTACSRAVLIADVIPGATVIVEDHDLGWWAGREASAEATFWLPLPEQLQQGERLEIRQELAPSCRIASDRRQIDVTEQIKLPPLRIDRLYCHADPTVRLLTPKPEANLEYEVGKPGEEIRVYHGVASGDAATFPSPPMQPGTLFRVRQGECDLWSDWSPYELAPALDQPVPPPTIRGTLFHCQKRVPIDLHHLLGGWVRLISDKRGELAHCAPDKLQFDFDVSLYEDEDITVERHICGVVASDTKTVQPVTNIGIGEVVTPLYVGDTAVAVEEVTSGARVDLWDQNRLLRSGYAPASDGGKVTVLFTDLAPLAPGQLIHARFYYCALFGRNHPQQVVYQSPEIDEISPDTFQLPLLSTPGPASPAKIEVTGNGFYPGSVALVGGSAVSTSSISRQRLTFIIPDRPSSPDSWKVRVRNPDGQMSNVVSISFEAYSPGSGGTGPPGMEIPPTPKYPNRPGDPLGPPKAPWQALGSTSKKFPPY